MSSKSGTPYHQIQQIPDCHIQSCEYQQSDLDECQPGWLGKIRIV